MSKDEINDIKLIKAEIERMKDHIQIFKGYGKTLDNIESALVGSTLNGHDGLVYKVGKITSKLDEFDKIKHQFNVAKWVFGIVFIALIGSLVKDTVEKTENKTENTK